MQSRKFEKRAELLKRVQNYARNVWQNAKFNQSITKMLPYITTSCLFPPVVVYKHKIIHVNESLVFVLF